MKIAKILSTVVLFLTIHTVKAEEAVKSLYNVSKSEVVAEISKMWNSENVKIKEEKHKYNGKTRYVILIQFKDLSLGKKLDKDLVQKTKDFLHVNVDDYSKKLKGIKIQHNFRKENKKKKFDTNYLYYKIDKGPRSKDCVEEPNEKVAKKCLQKFIHTHLVSNFDVGSSGLDYGTYKIITKFTISKDGTIKDIDTGRSNEILNAEMQRVLSTLKIEEPGFDNGEYVNVKYAIPLTLNLE
ncbi:hypothetical protein [Aureivirga sp. CE67]|uniref:hypothetical protein n=1 Tax=Aureivirga sp. CE67 TaxID=1788983 RepID=UPI0018CB125C|nr:hypothetical protein [Aureivirga sp. CE67]